MILAQTTITVTDQGPEWWQLSLLLLPVYIATVVMLAALAVWLHRARAPKPRAKSYAQEVEELGIEIDALGRRAEDLSQFPDGWEIPLDHGDPVPGGIRPGPGTGHTKVGG